MKHFYRTKNGFTFTEVLVSSILIVIIWLGAIGILAGIGFHTETKHRIQAIYLGKQWIEWARRQPFVTFNGLARSPVTIDPTDNVMGNLTINVPAKNADIMTVQVAIEWIEPSFGGGSNKIEYYTTDITNDVLAIN